MPCSVVVTHVLLLLLQSSLHGLSGPQPWRLLLLLKAQVILFRRYPSPLRPFKYPAFPLLLEHLHLGEGAGSVLSKERLPLAEAAARLLHLV